MSDADIELSFLKSFEGDLQALINLVEGGVDVNVVLDGETLCSMPAYKGHLELLQWLHGKGADINAKNNDGDTPFHQASASGHLDVLQWLHENGADVNAKNNDGKTPREAADDDDDDSRALFDRWVNYNKASDEGNGASEEDVMNAALWDACDAGDLETVTDSVVCGADVNSRAVDDHHGDDDHHGGRTPCHYASRGGHLRVLQWLHKKGADINAENNVGDTPFHMAAENGRHGVVQWLHENGADINAKNNDGWTPFHYASRGEHRGVLELLHGLGADINAKNNHGKTPHEVSERLSDTRALFETWAIKAKYQQEEDEGEYA